MELIYAKVLSGCVIFVITLLCGVVPFLLLRSSFHKQFHRRGKEERDNGSSSQGHGHSHGHNQGHDSLISARLNSLQCFAVGVFVATCLMHLLPEAREAMAEAELSLSENLPVSEMIVSLGFLLLLVVENVTLACQSRGRRVKMGHKHTSKKSSPNASPQSKHNATKTSTSSCSTSLASCCESDILTGGANLLLHGLPQAPHSLFRQPMQKEKRGVVIFRRQFSLGCDLAKDQQSKTKNLGDSTRNRRVHTHRSQSQPVMKSAKSYGTYYDVRNPGDNKVTSAILADEGEEQNISPQWAMGSVSVVSNNHAPPTMISKPNVTDPYLQTQCMNDAHQEKEKETVFIQPLAKNERASCVDSDQDSHSADSADVSSEAEVNLLKKSDNKQKRLESTTDNEEEEMDQRAALKSMVLLLALSLHTVFDGLVVGLQDTDVGVWTLLSAITLHKALVAASVALTLLESHHGHPRTTLLYLSLFSLVAPVGLAVGIALTETPFDTRAQALTSGILQSVATGTFMYVTFVESMQGRFDKGTMGRRLLDVFLVLMGFGCVLAIKVLMPST